MLSQKNKQGWRNPWVFGLIAVILAGVVINIKFYWNVTQHPVRLLDDHYNVKSHNQYDAKWVQQQAERSTLGWQVKLHSPHRLENDALAEPSAAKFILLASPAELILELANREGKPIQGGQVFINAQWPEDPKFDTQCELFEKAPGRYVGQLKFPRAGNWDLIIKATHESRQFEMEQKVFVEISKQP